MLEELSQAIQHHTIRLFWYVKVSCALSESDVLQPFGFLDLIS